MKKQNFLTILLSASIILSSCATAIKAPPVEAIKIKTELDATPQMDFIGFKIDSKHLQSISYSNNTLSEFAQAEAIRDTKSFKNIGRKLESAQIAKDKTFSYFGIYSPQDLELYKSTNRYVTFIDVVQSKFFWDDNAGARRVQAGFGAGLMVDGLFCTIAGIIYKNLKVDERQYQNADTLNKAYDMAGNIYLVAGIPAYIIGTVLTTFARKPTKTDFIFDGIYNIYVYDTTTKEIIMREPVEEHIFDTLSGSYDYDEASKNAVHEYISAKLSNAILLKYQKINRKLKNLK